VSSFFAFRVRAVSVVLGVALAWGCGGGGGADGGADNVSIDDRPTGGDNVNPPVDATVGDDVQASPDAASDGFRVRDNGMTFTDATLSMCFVAVTPFMGASGTLTANGRNFSDMSLSGHITNGDGSTNIGAAFPITATAGAGGTFTFAYRIMQSLPAGDYRFYARDGLFVCEAWGPFRIQ